MPITRLNVVAALVALIGFGAHSTKMTEIYADDAERGIPDAPQIYEGING